MRSLALLVGTFAALAFAPFLLASEVSLNAVVMVLYAALLGQSWNLLGGYGGQFSFGHAAYFGTGAYAIAVVQVQLGWNPWSGLALAAVAAALVALVVGVCTFRYGLRGSYFALVTLAFAEVLRILSNSVPFTGAGVGLLIPLEPGVSNLQFTSKAGFFWLIWAMCLACFGVAWWLARSRFGAQLMAVRDNEEAARALGVNPFRVKLGAILLSGGFSGLAGAFYAQYFLYLDPYIAYGPAISVESLLVPIVGGIGTLFGPLLGAAALHLVAEGTRELLGDVPGASLAMYGVLLVVMVMFVPRGLAGLAGRIGEAFSIRRVVGITDGAGSGAGPSAAHVSAETPNGAIATRVMAETPPAPAVVRVSAETSDRPADRNGVALLELVGLCKRFGGVTAAADVTLTVPTGSITSLIGPNGAGKTTTFALVTGFHAPDAGEVRFAGERIDGLPPEAIAARGLVRTFQIVQPFAGQSVRENIAVGAHLHRRSRRAALARAEEVAHEVGLEDRLDVDAASLTVAGRKRLEVARALATDPRLILFDEVLAGLNPSEIRDVIPVIRRIRDAGITLVLIEHVMQAVMSLSEHTWVMNQGTLIAEGPPREVVADPAVIEAYLGRGMAERLARSTLDRSVAEAQGDG